MSSTPRGEPIGWNVYSGTSGRDMAFREFIPNEPALAAEAARLADDVEAFTAGQD